MVNSLQPVRGTRDILKEEMRLYRQIVETSRKIALRFGFEEITTPIFEFTDVFKRTLGETSDIVSKEMYSFEDRGGDSITLRPEFTAGIARAFISNGVQQDIPCKFFSSGPLFRYERPQKGRYRQFSQINFELMGAAGPLADAECISLAWLILKDLRLQEAVRLEINSLGDAETRNNYRNALVSYLTAHQDRLSEESRRRLAVNPLRILDSKEEQDKKIVAEAPELHQFFSPDARKIWESLLVTLAELGIPYTHNPRLVRGLDYYSHTVFEFTTDRLGSQNAVLAGGRYDGLVEQMGGNPTPCFGFAGGIDRLVALYEVPLPKIRPIALIPIGDAAEPEAVRLTYMLRKEGFAVDMAYSGNVAKRFKRANKIHAVCAITIGEEELTQQSVKLKWLDSGQEEMIAAERLLDKIASLRLEMDRA